MESIPALQQVHKIKKIKVYCAVMTIYMAKAKAQTNSHKCIWLTTGTKRIQDDLWFFAHTHQNSLLKPGYWIYNCGYLLFKLRLVGSYKLVNLLPISEEEESRRRFDIPWSTEVLHQNLKKIITRPILSKICHQNLFLVSKERCYVIECQAIKTPITLFHGFLAFFLLVLISFLVFSLLRTDSKATMKLCNSPLGPKLTLT